MSTLPPPQAGLTYPCRCGTVTQGPGMASKHHSTVCVQREKKHIHPHCNSQGTKKRAQHPFNC